MLPEDDRMIETCRNVFKCFNVNFRLLKTIYVHFLVCYLNKLQNVRRNDKDSQCPTSKSEQQLKNTSLKLLKTNAAIWFNKTCKVKQLKPNYTNVEINGQRPQSMSILYCNFSKEQSMLPEDDRMIIHVGALNC